MTPFYQPKIILYKNRLYHLLIPPNPPPNPPTNPNNNTTTSKLVISSKTNSPIKKPTNLIKSINNSYENNTPY